MSSEESAQYIAEFRIDLISAWIVTAMAALSAYEWLITLNDEIVFLRRRSWSITTWIYVVNRYVLVTVLVLTICPSTSHVCNGILKAIETLQAIQYIIIALFTSLRVFALTDRHYYLAGFVFLLGFMPVATNINYWSRSKTLYIIDPLFGAFCTTNYHTTKRVARAMEYSSRLSSIFADVIVLAITWHRTGYQIKQAWRINARSAVKASEVLLFNGSIYFVALLAMNILYLMINEVKIFVAVNPAVPIISTLQPMLIGRFLLNLKSVSEPEGQSALPSSPSQFTVPEFRFPSIAEVIDNMGQDLHQPSENDVEDDDEEECPDTPTAATAEASTPTSGSDVELRMESEYTIQVAPRSVDV